MRCKPALGSWLLLLSSLALVACTESNQSRSDKIAAAAKSSGSEKRLTIADRSTDIEVARTEVLSTADGLTVAAVELKNSGPEQSRVPVVFDGYGKGKKSRYRNNEPGLQDALQRVGSIGAGKTIWWVNDQIPVSGIKRVRVNVGAGEKNKKVPAVSVDKGHLESDPDGAFLVGTVTNKSKSRLTSTPLYAVGVKNGKVVAAGRAIIQQLNPSGKTNYRILLAGKPDGATLSIYAAPNPI